MTTPRVPDPYVLAGARMDVVGRVVDASNGAFLVSLDPGDAGDDGTWPASGPSLGLYKPVRGEEPLWDFPDGALAFREVAAYLVSRAGGFDAIPPTVLVDGPFGVGSLQWWVSQDPTQAEDALVLGRDDAGFEAIVADTSGLVDPPPDASGEGEPRDPVLLAAPADVPDDYRVVIWGEDGRGKPVCVAHAASEELRTIAALDILINNADRKGTHLIRGLDGRLWGVDHGICLHHEDKLRTILWGFAGEPLGDRLTGGAERVRQALLNDSKTTDDDPAGLLTLLGQLLTEIEVVALLERAERLARRGEFRQRPQRRHTIPWPPV